MAEFPQYCQYNRFRHIGAGDLYMSFASSKILLGLGSIDSMGPMRPNRRRLSKHSDCKARVLNKPRIRSKTCCGFFCHVRRMILCKCSMSSTGTEFDHKGSVTRAKQFLRSPYLCHNFRIVYLLEVEVEDCGRFHTAFIYRE